MLHARRDSLPKDAPAPIALEDWRNRRLVEDTQ